MMWAEQEIKAPDVLGKDYQILVDKMKDTASQLKNLKKSLKHTKTQKTGKMIKGKK